jgi:hypothetical protein
MYGQLAYIGIGSYKDEPKCAADLSLLKYPANMFEQYEHVRSLFHFVACRTEWVHMSHM